MLRHSLGGHARNSRFCIHNKGFDLDTTGFVFGGEYKVAMMVVIRVENNFLSLI
jgi:hypothetical protein